MIFKILKEYITSLEIAEDVYIGKRQPKRNHSVGVYNCKHALPHETIFKATENDEVSVRCITILIHWDESYEDMSKVAWQLFDLLCATDNAQTSQGIICNVIPLVEGPVDIGMDDCGTCEAVLELAIIYHKMK